MYQDDSRESGERWMVYFLRMAQLVASKSKDSTKVGCVIVSQATNQVLSMGFNGIPRGVEDTPATVPERYERPTKYKFVVHAEANAIAAAAANGIRLRGADAYCTLHPCVECVKLLIQAGIENVYYLKEPADLAPSSPTWRDMLEDAKTIASEAGMLLQECELDPNAPMTDISADYLLSC